MRGEPIGPQHREGLLALLGDTRVGATLGGVATPDDVDAQIASMARHWADRGFGWYAFLDRGSGALVARGGPHATHVAGRDEVEIGWTVDPDRWVRGWRPSWAPRRSRTRSARSGSPTSSRSR